MLSWRQLPQAIPQMPMILKISLFFWAVCAIQIVPMLLGWWSDHASTTFLTLFIFLGYGSGAQAVVHGQLRYLKNNPACEKDVSPDDAWAGNLGVIIIMFVTFGLTLILVDHTTRNKLDPILQTLLVSIVGYLLMLLAHYRGIVDALDNANKAIPKGSQRPEGPSSCGE
jgi:uncharacterized membrane protein